MRHTFGSLLAILALSWGVCAVGPVGAASAQAAAAAGAAVGGRTLTHAAIIHVPAHDLFQLFTTGDGIVRAWGVAKAKVDFRIGGQIRTAYDANADLDAPTSIVNTILAFEPDRMLAIKATAPAGAPEWLRLACEGTHTVITLDAISPEATRVTITGIGFGEGEVWDQAYAFFDKGNAWTLDQMREKLGPVDPARAAAVMEMLRAYVGDWTFETTGPDGKAFRGLTRFSEALDGAWVVADGWLGGDEGMVPHAHWVSGVDPATGLVVYTNYFEKGHLGSGHIEWVDAETIGFEMPVYTAQEAGASPPAPTNMYFEFQRTGPDAFTSRFYMGIDRRTADAKPMMELAYTRVATIPEKFLRMKGQEMGDSIAADLAPVVVRGVVSAPIGEVWRAWSTTEGLSGVLGRTTNVECRVGGPFEILWSDDAPAGERGSEGCTVLSFVPERMISFTWNAPPQFAHARQQHSHVVVELRAVGEGSTEITLTNLGFDDLAKQFPDQADEYRQVRAYFANAWPRVVGHFGEHYAK